MTTRPGGRVDLLVAVVAAACAIWFAVALTDWSDLLTGVSIGSPWGSYNAHLGEVLLFAPGVQAAPVIATLLLHLAIGAIGYRFVMRPIWGGAVSSGATLFLAGLVPGSLMLIAVTRLVTFVLPHAIAPWLTFALMLALAALALAPKAGPRLAGRPIAWGGMAVALAACAGMLIFQVHFDGFHISGEASLWLLRDVFQSDAHGLAASGARMPLISQHYDEAALLYAPAFAFLDRGATPLPTLTVMHWLFLAGGRLGMACLVYAALRGMRLDQLSAFVSTAFVFLSSLSLNPASSALLFDSLNPLAYGLHTARILAMALPFLILSAAINVTAPLRLRAYVIAAALGLGLAAMPIHLLTIWPWAFALLALVALNPNAGASPTMWRAACAGALLTLLAFSFTYAAQDAPDAVRAFALLAAAGLGGILLLWVTFSSRGGVLAKGRFAPLAVAMIAFAGYFVGIALLGNFAISRIAPLLDGVWPWNGLDVSERLAPYQVIPGFGISASQFCDGVWLYRNHIPASHCGSLPDFVRDFGLPFVAAAGVLAWRLTKMDHKSALSPPAATTALWALMLCVFALAAAFFVYDFMAVRAGWAPDLSIWLRSRFVEPWFNSAILIAAGLFFSQAGALERRWVQGAMLICVAFLVFNPMVFSGQWIANVFYLTTMLTGR